MSLITFHQDENSLTGISVFDALPEWSINGPSKDDNLLYPTLESEDGHGSWLIFNHSHSIWGTILRSGNAPYNDCLPPGELLLLEVFRNHTALEPIVKSLYREADEQFLNSFLCLLGNREDNSLYWFEGGVQSEHGHLDPGQYCLRDNDDPEENSSHEELRVGTGASRESLTEQLETMLEADENDNLLAQDGMRSTNCAVVFRWDEDALAVDYHSGLPPQSSGTSIEVSPSIAS